MPPITASEGASSWVRSPAPQAGHRSHSGGTRPRAPAAAEPGLIHPAAARMETDQQSHVPRRALSCKANVCPHAERREGGLRVGKPGSTKGRASDVNSRRFESGNGTRFWTQQMWHLMPVYQETEASFEGNWRYPTSGALTRLHFQSAEPPP